MLKIFVALALLWTVTGSNLPVIAQSKACTHPYNPVRQGQRTEFRFTDTKTKATRRVIRFTESVSAAGFSTKSISDGRTSKSFFICDGGGITNPRTGLVQEMETQWGPSKNYSLGSTGWSTLPPPDRMRIGGTWGFTQRFRIEVNGRVIVARGRTVARVVASERVTVPAGTFQALKIVREHTSVVEEPNVKPLTATDWSWYVLGVGEVKGENFVSHERSELVSVR